MHKFLTNICVITERNRLDASGQIASTYRLNPYNPLSYITISITAVVGAIMFGLVGLWRELPRKNPFTWQ